MIINLTNYNSNDNYFCFFSEHNTSASAKTIDRVIREHHEYLIAYIEGAGVIPITNHLFSSEIITEYMHKCVTQSPYTQNASIVALECRLYVTLDHNPEGKLETLLNVFMKVESTGPDVASMIQKVSTMYNNYNSSIHNFFTGSNSSLSLFSSKETEN